MEKIKLVDKEFWEYFRLCSKDSYKEWLIHFEGWKKVLEPIGVAVTTTILTLISQRLFNGALKISDINIAITSVIGAPILWFGFVYLVKLILSPFRIYKQQEDELEKFNWKKVRFEICEYDVFKDVGWGIKVINNKKHTIHLILELDYLEFGDKPASPTIRRHYLGNTLEKEITCTQNGETVIEAEKEKVFPLTKISDGTPSFLTFPESDRNIGFSKTESLAFITVRGGVEDTEKLNRLDENKVEIKILADGSIKPFDKKNGLWR